MESGQFIDRLIIKLVGKKYCKELLEKVPHFEYMDLAVVFMLDENTVLSHEHIKDYEISEEELFNMAAENTRKAFPAVFVTMEEVLAELTGEEYKGNESAMYVLSNKNKYLGASTMMYRNQLKEIGESLNDDFYILPSSIHERATRFVA